MGNVATYKVLMICLWSENKIISSSTKIFLPQKKRMTHELHLSKEGEEEMEALIKEKEK